ncbi:MAG: hypothetical protein LBH91_03105 [Prevotellaceae bacterium]|jgi:hypothetical protein|nr:hypothetical protein [Prevotellaceae bacterium]
MAFNTLYTLQIAERVQEITRQYYEPGRQDRNYRAVWKYYVLPVHHIKYKTYLRYLKIDVEAERKKLMTEYVDN